MKRLVAAVVVVFSLVLPKVARAQGCAFTTSLTGKINETCGNVGIGVDPNSAYMLDVAGPGHFLKTITLDTATAGVSPHLLFTNEGGVADIKIDRTILTNGTPLADFRFVNAAYTNVNMRLSDTGVLTVLSDIGSQTGTLQMAGTGNSFIWGSLGVGHVDQNAYPARLAVQGPAGGLAFESTDNTNSTFAISHQSTPIAATVLARGTSGSNLFLGANDTGLLMLNKNGNVGIASNSPAAKFEVGGDIRVTNQILPTSGAGLELEYVPNAAGGTGAVRAYDRSGSAYKILTLNDAIMVGNGNLGIGSTQVPPASPIETALNVAGPVVETRGANPILSLQSTASTQEDALWTSGAGLFIDSVGHATPANNFIAFRTNNTASSYAPREVMRVTGDGNVTIGNASANITANLTVNGTITGTSVFNAVYQDVAEWVPAHEELAPGTVVVLDPSNSNEVMASRTAYDTAVAGVVSAQPGVILGRPGDAKSKVATLGRVRVRVDATKHPVRVGDLLVTSDTPGMAMVSEPVDLGGVKIHRPGTLIGKALEPLSDGKGEVLVLLSLQ